MRLLCWFVRWEKCIVKFMSKEKFIVCEDRIQVDDMLCEMTLDGLVSLKNVIETCKGCPGCNAMIADIQKEISIRKG